MSHADDEAPLLGGAGSPAAGKKGEREGKATMMSCVANLANTILGTGMLAMPHAFASGGLLPGIVTVFFCGATATLGLYFLARSAAKAPHRAASFAALSKLTFPRLSRAFDIAIFLKCYGVSISYLIIIGALMPRAVASFLPDADAWLLDRRLWILFSMCILCPLAFLRKLDSLKFTSYVALCAVANLIFVVIYKYFDQTGLPPRGPVKLVALGPSFISSLPVQIFAFTCAQNIFAVFNEIRANTQERLNIVIGTSIGSATLIYQVLGILGYLTFGTHVGSNIIEMYPHSVLVSICQLALVVLVLFSYPLQVHPARASLDKAIFPPSDDAESGDHDSAEIPLGRFVVETSAILLTTFLISMFVDDLSVILGFVGATGSVSISFILPSVYFISLFKNSESRRDRRLRVAAAALFVWGVAVMIISLSLQLWHLLSQVDEDKTDSPSAARPVSLPSETIDHILSFVDVTLAFNPDAPLLASRHGHRNPNLALAALISHQWNAMAHRRLYRHLKLDWRSSNSPLLVRSFRENPGLYALVVAIDFDRLQFPLAGIAGAPEKGDLNWLGSEERIEEIPGVQELALSTYSPVERDVDQAGPPAPTADDDEADDLLPTGTLDSLKVFISKGLPEGVNRKVFAQKPLKLDFMILDTDDLDDLTPLLPLLTELKFLRLGFPPSFTPSTEFLEALSTTSLLRLESNVQPLDSFADHLPPTIRSIALTIPYGAEWVPFDVETLGGAPSWRKRSSAPNLLGVAFSIPNLDEIGRDVDDRRKRIGEIVDEAKELDFQLLVLKRDYEYGDEEGE
ncbi:hypothetical protein RQP46_003495 [Phenoliferia psychrophenolica]